MAQFSRTWGQAFYWSPNFTDSARLGRGRSYASGKILDKIAKNKSYREGSINPYFEFTKNLDIKLQLRSHRLLNLAGRKQLNISRQKQALSQNCWWMRCRTTLNQLCWLRITSPAPQSKDFKTSCSCPDWANPCKHIGCLLLVASQLDHNPFILFELRGLSKDELQELAKSPLGRALSRADCQRNSIVSFTILLYPTRKSTC